MWTRLLFGLLLAVGQWLTADPDVYSAFPFAALIPAAISAIGALGGRGGRTRQNQANSQAIQFLQQVGNGTLRMGTDAFNQGMAALNSVINSGGFSPELRQGLQELTGFISNLPSTPGQVVRLPEGLGDTSQLGNAGLAAEGFGFEQLGVRSNQEIELLEQANRFENRARNDPRLNVLGDFSEEILRRGGRTGETEAARKEFQKLLENFGQTPQTRELSAAGRKLLDAGGMTPALRDLQNTFQQQIQSGGMTPEARQLFNELLPVIQSRGQGGALLSMDQVTSFARDEAAQLAAGTAEARQRQAFARGSAPGTVAASGLQNQALAEADSEILQAQAKGIRDAALQQQVLQLQQFLGASGVAGDVTRQATQLIASANTGLGDIARASSQNISTGGGLLTGAAQIGATNMGTAQTGLSNIFNNELGRMQFAGGLAMDIESQRRELERLSQAGLLGSANVAQNRGALGLQALGIPVNAGVALRGQDVDQRGQDITQRGQDVQFGLGMSEIELRGLLGSLGISGDALNRVIEAGRSAGAFGTALTGQAVQSGAAQTGAAGNFAQNPFWNSLLTGGTAGLLDFANQRLGSSGGTQNLASMGVGFAIP